MDNHCTLSSCNICTVRLPFQNLVSYFLGSIQFYYPQILFLSHCSPTIATSLALSSATPASRSTVSHVAYVDLDP
jgi:hypothetical protein